MLLDLSNRSFGSFGGGLAVMSMLLLSIVIPFCATLLPLIIFINTTGTKFLASLLLIIIVRTEKWFLKSCGKRV